MIAEAERARNDSSTTAQLRSARSAVIVEGPCGKGKSAMPAIEENTGESRIARGSKASGKLIFRGPVRIEGEADGEITGDEVVIAQSGVVSARIDAARVVIAGTFSGEVTARDRLELLATARVECTATTSTFVLNEGAHFDGDCRMLKNRAAA
jgi:cytoskeletal protein CcmA (bactofilin family)